MLSTTFYQNNPLQQKWLPHLPCIPVVSCLPGKKVKKLVFQALSEEGTKGEDTNEKEYVRMIWQAGGSFIAKPYVPLLGVVLL